MPQCDPGILVVAQPKDHVEIELLRSDYLNGSG
jgi:hypothetical protein